MPQLENQVIALAGVDSTLRRAAAQTLRAEGAQVLEIAPSSEAVVKAAQTAGRVDALVNFLHCGADWQPFAAADDTALGAALDQVRAFAQAMRAAYPWLRQSRGRVVNVGTIHGATAYAGLSDSVSADWALQGLTRAVGVEWARDEVLVNYLGPGALDLPELRAFRARDPQRFDAHVNGLALGRLGDPVEDFGGALLFLLSDEACFLVGHPVHADGGQHLVAPLFEPGA